MKSTKNVWSRALVMVAASSAAAAMLAGTAVAATAPATAGPVAPTTVAQLHSALQYAITRTGYTTVPRRNTPLAPTVESCWRCIVGPAAALAAGYVSGGPVADLTKSVHAFDLALRSQASDGSFVPAAGGGSHDIDTMFFTAELGSTYQVLLPYLNVAHQASWTKAIRRGALYLAHNGNITYYSNGNLNIGGVVVFAAAWKATGDPMFQRDMTAALNFAMNPGASWAGRGFVTTKVPTKADGSDGAGYFVESGPTGSGFDPDYTQLQATQATRLYLLTGDARSLKLLNMLVNQLMTRTDTTNFHIDVSGGSRHPAAGEWRYMITPALSTLVWRGGRTDLAQYLPGQLAASAASFQDASQYDQPGTWYSVGSDLATTIFAAPGYAATGPIQH